MPDATVPSRAFEAMVFPFPLGLQACPKGRLLAEVVIGLSPSGGLETHCFVGTGEQRRNLWRTARVTPTADGTQIAWRSDAARLAVSQFRTVIVADLEGPVWRHQFPEPVVRLAYTALGDLLVLAGRTVYRCPEPDGAAAGETEALRTEILALGVHGGTAYVAEQQADMIVVAALHGEEVGRFSAAGRQLSAVSLDWPPSGDSFLELRDAPVEGSCRTTILRCRDGRIFLDEAVGVGIAEPSVSWHALDGERIALLGELDDVSGLWEIEAGGSRRRLSDPALELELAIWSPDGDAVIVSGRDLEQLGGRRSQCLDRDGQVLWHRPQSILLAQWIGGGRLACAIEGGGDPVGWEVARTGLGTAAPPLPAPARPAISLPLPGGGPESRMVLVGERLNPKLGIVYVMGPHRFFANGAERLFYHHAIRAQAEAVCREGALLLGLNGAAALGAGRRRRLPAAPPYDSTSVADIAAAAAYLRGLGAPRIVLVAASLGCLPTIRFLAAEQIDGAALLNPVYSSEIPPLRPWRQLYGADSLLEAALARHAPAIRTPLLIVHGQRDPISPSQHSSDFFMALPEDLACDYVSVPDEGHIFQTDAGWRILLEKMRGFLEAALPRQEERVG